MQFEPRVLDADLQAVREAKETQLRLSRELYTKHLKLCKIACLKNRPDLKDASRDCFHHAEMIVVTRYDAIHFEAQMRHRRVIGAEQCLPEMGRIRSQVLERNAESSDALPKAQEKLNKILREIQDGDRAESSSGSSREDA